MGRDVMMLIIGSLITLTTSGISSYFADRKAERKEVLSKKLELNQDLSKDIGTRFYLTYDILSHKITVDSSTSRDTITLNHELASLSENRMVWNQNINSYKALLSYYYGNKVLLNFIDSVYRPLLDLGKYASDKKMYTNDSTLVNRLLSLNNNIQVFMQKIYTLAYTKRD